MIDRSCEQGEQLQPIAAVQHHVLPHIAPTGEMVDGPRELKSKRMRLGIGGLFTMFDRKTDPSSVLVLQARSG